MEPKGRLARWVLDLQQFNFSVVHRAGRLHNNADALSRLVQTQPCEQVTNSSAASADSAEDSTDKTDIVAVVKTIVQVKLSHGRIATITFQGSKPLKTELIGTLVTNEMPITISSRHLVQIPAPEYRQGIFVHKKPTPKCLMLHLVPCPSILHLTLLMHNNKILVSLACLK